jgi:hypothetical protein
LGIAVPVLDKRGAVGKIVNQNYGRTHPRRTIQGADFFAA